MTITGGSGLPKDDIERMMRDAEAHAEEDRKRREEAEVRNSAESLYHQTEKFLADNGDKVPEEAKSNVEGPLADLKKALDGDDIEAIKSAAEKVATTSQALGAAMYANAQQSAGAGDAGSSEGASSAGSSDDDVVDAEIVDEGDEK
jgi:molecular chaperone DnaK